MNTKDVNVKRQYLKVFIVGDPGTGKSCFAATFPTPGYLLNFDNTEISYVGKDFTYENFATSPKGWIQAEKEIKALRKLADSDEPFPYKTVVLDSTTAWEDLAMTRALQLDPKRSAVNGPVWNIHYSMVKNLIEGYMRQILELPCNLVVIGHLKRLVDADTGGVLGIEPMLTGQLSTKIPSYFDEVYYAENKTTRGKTKFIVHTLAKGHFKARSRVSGVRQILPAELPNTYADIIKHLG